VSGTGNLEIAPALPHQDAFAPIAFPRLGYEPKKFKLVVDSTGILPTLRFSSNKAAGQNAMDRRALSIFLRHSRSVCAAFKRQEPPSARTRQAPGTAKRQEPPSARNRQAPGTAKRQEPRFEQQPTQA